MSPLRRAASPFLMVALVALAASPARPAVCAEPTAAPESPAAENKANKRQEKVDFRRQVLPILAGRCFKCHGPDEETVEADLRFDLREHAIKELDSGETAIVPGKPQASALLARVTADDAYERMPPAGAGDPLSAEQIDVLRRWIAQGAQYARHWSLTPPERAPLPKVAVVSWPAAPLDRFVLARLERENLEPAPPADRATEMRRAWLALTGLPPTPMQVDAYLADTAPGAYGRLVDRALADPAYGERWARVWLDLARYADSAGYAQDPSRTIWRYRDWVIQAINQNLPFDKFTVWQLAGDMLPNPTEEQLLATAFHRNTMTNSEGGTNDEEFRNAAVVDRVNTTMQVWMGMTMGCAQCHTHKYDPITQEEYFRFFAVFNNTEDADRGDERPTFVTYTLEQEQRRQELAEEIARLEKELSAQEKAPTEGKPQPRPSQPAGPLRPRFIRVELPGKDKFLSLAEVEVFAGGKNIAPQGKATQSSTAYEGPARLAIDGNTNGDYFVAKSTTHTDKGENPWWEVDLGGEHAVARIAIWNRTDGSVGSRLSNFRVVALDAERRPLWVRSVGPPPSPSVELALPAAGDKLSAEDRRALAAYRGEAPADSSSPLAKRIAALKKELAGIKGAPTPIMRELPPGRRRKTHVQLRGNFLDTGKQVSAGVPKAFHPLPAGQEPNRLNVARWLVDRRNPLTARVIVNRYWEQLFGVGLVETSEDFGVQGEPPSHPELLDYLAVEFMKHNWDTKWLLREIVTSQTYRQSSRMTQELIERDPRNRLLARGPRFRLSAEMIRDQALAAAGLLSRKMYGESVRPPRPKLGLRAAFGGSTDWQTSQGEDKFRRGLYTRWRRTTPYPSMMTFDAPSREVCTIRRIRTNTPLQALVTLNDPVYVEAAQALARRTVSRGGMTVESRVSYGFRRCVGRPPTSAETERLASLFQAARAEFEKAPADAQSLATDPIGPLPPGADAAELAAWTVVANVMMNLDEFLAPR